MQKIHVWEVNGKYEASGFGITVTAPTPEEAIQYLGVELENRKAERP